MAGPLDSQQEASWGESALSRSPQLVSALARPSERARGDARNVRRASSRARGRALLAPGDGWGARQPRLGAKPPPRLQGRWRLPPRAGGSSLVGKRPAPSAPATG